MAPPSAASGWLAASGLPAGICAGTVLRHAPGQSPAPWGPCNLGDRCGDDAAAVVANRHGLLDWLALPAAPCWLRQVHGVQVHRAGPVRDVSGEPPPADAAVAFDAGVVLAVLSADCLPVVLAAADGSAIGIAHAGWRGLVDGVLERTLQALGVPGRALCAWLGPAIGPGSFEVGPELRAQFLAADPAAAAAFRRGQGDRYLADLYLLARQRLQAAGLVQISGGGLDTFTEPDRFHSYRRDGQRSGRMATLVWKSANPHIS